MVSWSLSTVHRNPAITMHCSLCGVHITRIPDEFITRFGNELDNVATITVPDGREWNMELKKCGGQIFFCNNWQQFAEYYCIYYGCYLDFKYEGNSKFNVVIYDRTSVEISYPFQTRRTNGEPNINCPSSASNGINPKNTSFCSKVQNNYAYVPGEFAKEHLKPNVPFMLQNYQGKQWEVSCVLDRASKTPMRITSGFCRFARENNLSKEVFYNFELIKRKPVVVLQATTSRTAEMEIRESKHFKKAILPSPIHDKEIRIPEVFITIYGSELKNVATITVPDGLTWKLELKKRGEDVYFCNKWKQFAEYYSLRYGCFMSFKYEGNSKFSVIIFDVTSVEICYPLKTPSTNGETNTECPRPTKRSRVEINYADDSPSEDEGTELNPSFTSTYKYRTLYINADFASKHLKRNVVVKLQNCNGGEQWDVCCTRLGRSGLRLGKGFIKFATYNNLSNGDKCKVELIKKSSPVVLQLDLV
ncbi:B3 DNA-binding domain protein [Medicago truncatula]|uniref:B3 DNA-binding domain protein n=1 Tax=Medicago truncatula TaxID=3880 RepID=A0A072UTW5_MEDTR|nr:B3 DNA-binding domain protein [Medicago truncatula]